MFYIQLVTIFYAEMIDSNARRIVNWRFQKQRIKIVFVLSQISIRAPFMQDCNQTTFFGILSIMHGTILNTELVRCKLFNIQVQKNTGNNAIMQMKKQISRQCQLLDNAFQVMSINVFFSNINNEQNINN
jgi:hypothetical protein